MDNKELEKLFSAYLQPPDAPLEEVILAEVRWIRGNPDVGSDKMKEKHGVTEEEVEDVLFAVPPRVEAKKHRDYPHWTIFWGQTTVGRWLFILCDDRTEQGKRILTPLTAFTPETGGNYWRRYE